MLGSVSRVKMEVTIIIPTCNNITTIGRVLYSVIKQYFLDFECIVIDSSDDDKTKLVVDKFIKMDNRIKYYHVGVKDTIYQRSIGIKLASGIYCCCIDADDYVSCDYISSLYNGLLNYGSDIATSLSTAKDIYNYEPPLNESEHYYDVYIGKNYKKRLKSFRKEIGGFSACCLMAPTSAFLNAVNDVYNEKANIKCYEDSILRYHIFFNSSSATVIHGGVTYYYTHQHPNSSRDYRSNLDNQLIDCTKVSFLLNRIIKESSNNYNPKQGFCVLLAPLTRRLSVRLGDYKTFKQTFKTDRAYLKNNKVLGMLHIFGVEQSRSEILLVISYRYNLCFLAYFSLMLSKKNNSRHKSLLAK